jgi:phosphoglycolate phosphatase-like HAD superfamily hydrolase
VWETLSVPFAGLIEILKARSGDVNLAVATAKDGHSVATLLANYGIASLFADGAVVDKEAGRSKRAHLRTLAERFDVAFDEITFIDDKANHLMETQQLGVRCLLAQWGYNGEREHVVARENGIGVISLDALEPYLFG